MSIKLSSPLINELINLLSGFDTFNSNDQLYDFIKLSDVDFLADSFPLRETSGKKARIGSFISYFKSKKLIDGRNALILLLDTIKFDEQDIRNQEISKIISQIKQVNGIDDSSKSLIIDSVVENTKVGPDKNTVSFSSLIKNAKHHVSNDNVREAIQLIKKNLNETSLYYKDIILLEARNNRILNNDLRGDSSPNYIQELKNKLNSDFLLLIDQFSDKDIV